MTVRVVHAAGYTFPAPVADLELDLRLAPASWEASRTHATELSVVPPPDGLLERCDRWGNTVHRVTFGRTVGRVSIAMHLTVAGEGGALPEDPASADDRAPPEGAPTASDAGFERQGAAAVVQRECAALTSGWRFEAHPAGADVSLAALLHDRRGRCLELARLLVWRLRSQSIPTRFVLGYVIEQARPRAPRERHAWVAYHDGLLWRQVDPSAPERSAADRFATAWGPRVAALLPVRARRPAGLSGVVGRWSTQVTIT